MRILIATHSLQGGGAERVAVTISEGLASRAHSVRLVTLSTKDTDAFRLSPSVERVELDLVIPARDRWQSVRNTIRRVRALRREIRQYQPDIVIGFAGKMTLLTLVACTGMRIPVAISLHSLPGRFFGRFSQWLMRRLYQQAAVVITPGAGLNAEFDWLPTEKRYVIPNPLPTNALADCRASLDHKRIASIGRLIPLKGFDKLILAFSQLAGRFPEWELSIIGEGPEYDNLQQLIEELELQTHIRLHGWIGQPEYILQNCALFAFASSSETFGNVLIEAMACGLPVISFDCPTGPREIIQHEQNGLLIPLNDIDGLRDAMIYLIEDESARRRMGQNAKITSQSYSVKAITQQWENLLVRIVH